MRLPGDLAGEELSVLIGRCGHEIARQTGIHIRPTTAQEGDHHVITIPRHESLRVGTLSAVLGDVSDHLSVPRDRLLETLFAK